MRIKEFRAVAGPALLAALLLVPFSVAAAEAPSTDAGVAAAKAWLGLVDNHEYARSWRDASSFFQSHITEDHWEKRIDEVRAPLGPLVSRKLAATDATTSLPGAPDGHYVVLQYQSSFAHKRAATETMVMMLDRDGDYRTTGYFIR
jgi:hypothetical protein